MFWGGLNGSSLLDSFALFRPAVDFVRHIVNLLSSGLSSFRSGGGPVRVIGTTQKRDVVMVRPHLLSQIKEHLKVPFRDPTQKSAFGATPSAILVVLMRTLDKGLISNTRITPEPTHLDK